jgi:hypothetical protein
LFTNWSNAGTVRILDLEVYSCGKKQMVLVDEAGVKYAGSNFLPTCEQYNFHYVMPRMTEAEAETFALVLGRYIIHANLQRRRDTLAAWAAAGRESPGYRASMEAGIATLEAAVPRCHRAVHRYGHPTVATV